MDSKEREFRAKVHQKLQDTYELKKQCRAQIKVFEQIIQDCDNIIARLIALLDKENRG